MVQREMQIRGFYANLRPSRADQQAKIQSQKRKKAPPNWQRLISSRDWRRAAYLMPSRSMRLRSILRARRTAAARSRARFSLGFS